jgi:cytochrome c biogenesis protein CcdA
LGGAGSLALSYAAGALSTLSPCVLPVLPIVLVSALQSHLLGPLALAIGLSGSFAAMGTVVAALGLSAGLDTAVLRSAVAVLMVALGALLLVPAWQMRLTQIASPLAARGGNLLSRMAPGGVAGQFAIGAMLGVVWVPCSGPTLGAAVGLAAQSDTMARAALMMIVFGLGAATPLLALAYGSRHAILQRREGLRRFSAAAKPAMGALLVAIGALVLTGLDKTLETVLTDAMPQWLVDLTTRF